MIKYLSVNTFVKFDKYLFSGIKNINNDLRQKISELSATVQNQTHKINGLNSKSIELGKQVGKLEEELKSSERKSQNFKQRWQDEKINYYNQSKTIF